MQKRLPIKSAPLQRNSCVFLGAWIWLLPAILLLALQTNALAEDFRYRPADALCAPFFSPDLAATAPLSPENADNLPTSFASPPCSIALPASNRSIHLLKRESTFLDPSAAFPAFSLPRPPPHS